MPQARPSNRPAIVAVVGALVAVCSPLIAPAPATADGLGGWWRDKMGVAELNAAGGTGKGITIAVIDSLINPNVPQLKGKKIPVVGFCAPGVGSTPVATTTDPVFGEHTTSIVNLLIGNGAHGSPKGISPDANVLVYANYQGVEAGGITNCDDPQSPQVSPKGGVYNGMIEGIRQAIAGGAKIISISQTLGPDPGVVRAIAQAQQHGVIVVTSTTDKTYALGMAYPGMVQVGGLNDAGAVQWANLQTGDLVAPGIDIGSLGGKSWNPGTASGTSLAAPIVAGGLADIWSKYPTATANQVLQAAVRGTGLSKNASGRYILGWRRTVTDGKFGDTKTTAGWGFFSPADAIKLNVTALPDQNPFGQLPAPTSTGTPTETSAPSTPATTQAPATVTPSATASATPNNADGGSNSHTGLVVGLVGGAVALLAVIGGLVVARSKRSRP